MKGASGADRRVRDLTRGIAQNDNIVCLIVPIWRNSSKPNMDVKDFEVVYLGWRILGSNIIARLFFWVHLLIFGVSKKMDAIILYSPLTDSLPFIPILRLLGIKVILEICDLMSNPSGPVSVARKFKGYYVKVGEFFVPKFVNGCITISDFLVKKIQQLSSNKPILKIPILTDTLAFKLGEKRSISFRQNYKIDKEELIVTYIGGLWYDEGVDILIQAFANLCQNYPTMKVKLIIAGKISNEPEFVDVEQMVIDLHLQTSVTLLGWIDTDQVVDLLSSSDILVVPQIDSPFNRAGLPTKLAEYSAIGKAIIATSVGDVPLYFKDGLNAKLVKASDVNSLQTALYELCNDSMLRENLSKNVTETAKKYFDYRSNGDKVNKFIETFK
jgi:glycosyltransferase involved in cell wall biosynthesis